MDGQLPVSSSSSLALQPIKENRALTTTQQILEDYEGRRAGLIKALTTDFDLFYNMCDPGSEEDLCLYAYPNQKWMVKVPEEDIPPDIPEPTFGINFARDGMSRNGWRSVVAAYSHAWLLAVSGFYSVRFQSRDRRWLFKAICKSPTVFDAVQALIERERTQDNPSMALAVPSRKEGNTLEKKHEQVDAVETLCGSCEVAYIQGEFWIACDVCEKWFHGECVGVSEYSAMSIDWYKCPACSSNKKACP